MEFVRGNWINFDENCEGCDEEEECKAQYEAWEAAGKPELEGGMPEDDYDEDGDDMVYDEDEEDWGPEEETTLRYKVGDKVVIRTDLSPGKDYGDDIFVGDMVEFLGKTMTISRTYGYKYSLEGGSGWNFTDEMIDHEASLALLPQIP